MFPTQIDGRCGCLCCTCGGSPAVYLDQCQACRNASSVDDDKRLVNSLDLQELAKSKVRKALATSPVARRRAVCMFPLMVAGMANDLRLMLETFDRHGLLPSPEAEQFMAFLENRICAVYREQFGAELGECSSKGASS